MTFLHIVAYGGTALGFCFITMSLACGLYYLAELVEEYTVFTKKIIKYTTIAITIIHIFLFLFDRYPFLPIVFSLACHGIYSLNLNTFPFINLTSPPFIASCVLVVVNHYIWFRYFTRHYAPFMDVAAFFGICVWLIPFAYFISLSANDNALPLSDPAAIDAIPSARKQGLFKNVLAFVKGKGEEIMPVANQGVYSNGTFGVSSERKSL